VHHESENAPRAVAVAMMQKHGDMDKASVKHRGLRWSRRLSYPRDRKMACPLMAGQGLEGGKVAVTHGGSPDFL